MKSQPGGGPIVKLFLSTQELLRPHRRDGPAIKEQLDLGCSIILVQKHLTLPCPSIQDGLTNMPLCALYQFLLQLIIKHDILTLIKLFSVFSSFTRQNITQ